MKNPKIVDLELNNDGVYSEKGKEKNVPAVIPKQHVKPKPKVKNNGDTFLGGIDIGLDFIEQVVPRVERFFKLRG